MMLGKSLLCSLKWPVLFRVGRKTLTQSTSQSVDCCCAGVQAGEELSDVSVLMKDVDDASNAIKVAARKVIARFLSCSNRISIFISSPFLYWVLFWTHASYTSHLLTDTSGRHCCTICTACFHRVMTSLCRGHVSELVTGLKLLRLPESMSAWTFLFESVYGHQRTDCRTACVAVVESSPWMRWRMIAVRSVVCWSW